MEWLIDIASGGAIGGLLGLGGKWLEGRQRLKEKEIDNKEKALARTHELSVVSRELSSAENIASIDATAKVSLADYGALSTSIEADAADNSMSMKLAMKAKGLWLSIIAFIHGIVSAVCRAMRPGICIALAWFTFWFVAEGLSRLPEKISDKLFISSIEQCITVILSLFGLAVGWYFAARPQNRVDQLKA